MLTLIVALDIRYFAFGFHTRATELLGQRMTLPGLTADLLTDCVTAKTVAETSTCLFTFLVIGS